MKKDLEEKLSVGSVINFMVAEVKSEHFNFTDDDLYGGGICICSNRIRSMFTNYELNDEIIKMKKEMYPKDREINIVDLKDMTIVERRLDFLIQELLRLKKVSSYNFEKKFELPFGREPEEIIIDSLVVSIGQLVKEYNKFFNARTNSKEIRKALKSIGEDLRSPESPLNLFRIKIYQEDGRGKSLKKKQSFIDLSPLYLYGTFSSKTKELLITPTPISCYNNHISYIFFQNCYFQRITSKYQDNLIRYILNQLQILKMKSVGKSVKKGDREIVERMKKGLEVDGMLDDSTVITYFCRSIEKLSVLIGMENQFRKGKIKEITKTISESILKYNEFEEESWGILKYTLINTKYQGRRCAFYICWDYKEKVNIDSYFDYES